MGETRHGSSTPRRPPHRLRFRPARPPCRSRQQVSCWVSEPSVLSATFCAGDGQRELRSQQPPTNKTPPPSCPSPRTVPGEQRHEGQRDPARRAASVPSAGGLCAAKTTAIEKRSLTAKKNKRRLAPKGRQVRSKSILHETGTLGTASPRANSGVRTAEQRGL